MSQIIPLPKNTSTEPPIKPRAEKLPTFSKGKSKLPKATQIEPIQFQLGSEVQTEGGRLESDDEEYDAILSDDDYEDVDDDDDLFAENVDTGISERVIEGIECSKDIYVEVEGEYDDDDDQEGEEEDQGADDLPEDDDLNDSDGENVDAARGSDDEGPDYPIFNPEVDFKGKINLTVGLKFPSSSVFRKALRWHAIENGYDYYYLHNTKVRVTAYCANRCACPWEKGRRLYKCKCNQKRKCLFKIHARKVKGENTFQVKSYRGEHVCGHQNVNPKISSQYLAERYLDAWRDDPGMKLSAFIARATREVRAEINYYLAWYSRKRALDMLFGDSNVEYARVWEYAAAIRKYNPGSTAIVKVEGVEKPKPRFQRMYICLQPCKEGFMAGCRPILGVDGAHLKGPYPGILLTIVAKDGNNNIFPVAWSVVEVENAETWKWFLELLVKDLASVSYSITWTHESEEVTYMSDRQKGLLEAFQEVVPNADVRYCCRHIWANFKSKFPGEIYREHFWKAARATTKHHFEHQMQAIKAINIDAFKYLESIPPSNWTRHAFTTRSKSGMIMNNCCESFNNVLREARTKPIISLMEWIRRYVMSRCCAKRKGLKKFEGHIMPSVVKMIERGLLMVSKMRVNQADLYEFEVDDEGDTYVVNLQTKVCGCYRWSLLGIPCWHALACIVKRRLQYEEFVHPAYHVTTYIATYAPTFKAMPGYKQWEEQPYPHPLPPPYRKMPGRPSKKKRVKEQGENQERVKRSKTSNKCSNCGGIGHYKPKCQNVTVPHVPGKGGRPKSGTSVPQATTEPTAAPTITQPQSTNSRARSTVTTTTKADSQAGGSSTVSASTSKAAGGTTTKASKKHPSVAKVPNTSSKTTSMAALIKQTATVHSSQASSTSINLSKGSTQ